MSSNHFGICRDIPRKTFICHLYDIDRKNKTELAFNLLYIYYINFNCRNPLGLIDILIKYNSCTADIQALFLLEGRLPNPVLLGDGVHSSEDILKQLCKMRLFNYLRYVKFEGLPPFDLGDILSQYYCNTRNERDSLYNNLLEYITSYHDFIGGRNASI